MRGLVEKDKIKEFQVTVKIGFRLEDQPAWAADDYAGKQDRDRAIVRSTLWSKRSPLSPRPCSVHRAMSRIVWTISPLSGA